LTNYTNATVKNSPQKLDMYRSWHSFYFVE